MFEFENVLKQRQEDRAAEIAANEAAEKERIDVAQKLLYEAQSFASAHQPQIRLNVRLNTVEMTYPDGSQVSVTVHGPDAYQMDVLRAGEMAHPRIPGYNDQRINRVELVEKLVTWIVPNSLS